MIQENLKKKINRLSFIYSQVAFEKKTFQIYNSFSIFII